MALKLPDDRKGPSRWTVRLGLFAVSLAGFAVLAHRLFAMPTPVAINIGTGALAIALIALVTGLVSLLRIWRHGTGGVIATGFGMAIAAALIGWPLAFVPVVRTLPRINDITTDTQTPPRFVTLAAARPAWSNSATYPGAVFATAQAKAYPDIRSFVIDRSAEETFEIVLAALDSKTMKFKPVSAEPPKGRYGQPGWIEIVDRTLVLGFTDDVVIRVDGDAKTARIDVRSASRYGRHDLGRNAQRVRRILKEIQAQYEATMPSADGTRLARRRKALVPKRRPEGGQTSAVPRSGQALSKSDAPRAPAQKDRQPSRDGRPSPGTRG